MARYFNEQKESILKKIITPLNMTVTKVSRLEGVLDNPVLLAHSSH
jgi:hypothetical protein